MLAGMIIIIFENEILHVVIQSQKKCDLAKISQENQSKFRHYSYRNFTLPLIS